MSRPAASPPQNAGRSAACLHEAYSEHTRRAGSARVPDAVQRDPRPPQARSRASSTRYGGEGVAAREPTLPSPAGLTRGSIFFVRTFANRMDCRVKPGNDDCDCCSRLPLTRHAAFAARHPLPAALRSAGRGGSHASSLCAALRPGHAIGGFFSTWPCVHKTHFLLDYNSKR